MPAAGTGTITNDDTAILSVSSFSAVEGDSGSQNYLFTVTLSNDVQDGFSAPLSTQDGTAQDEAGNNDYLAKSESIAFAGSSGESHSLLVTVNGDTLVELDEAFSVAVGALSAIDPTAADDIAIVNGTGTILNDDRATISLGDVAEFVVESVENPKVRNKTFQLGGPDHLSPLEVVELFERVGGKRFDVEFVPESALHAQMKSASNSLERSFAGLMLGYHQGYSIDMTETLNAMPVERTTIGDYAESILSVNPEIA